MSAVRVVFLGRLAKEDVSATLKKVPGIDLLVTEDFAQMLKALRGAEVLVTPDIRGDERKLLSDALRSSDRSVRWIQCLSAGYEGLVRHGLPEDVVLTNQGGAVGPAVAEQAMALLLALARRLPEAVAAKPRHEWDRSYTGNITALEGRNLAVIGFGHIGKEIAKRARAFEMTVLGVSRSGTNHPLAHEMHPVTELRTVLARAEAIVVAAPQTHETLKLIGAAELAVCKPETLFVNVSRGRLVDTTALTEALQKRRIAGAGLDVTEPEPLPPDHPLWDCPNLIITPHVAGGGSKKSRARILKVVAENFARYLAGKPVEHVVR